MIWRIFNIILSIVSIATIFKLTLLNRTTVGIHAMPFIRTIEHIRQQPELIREMVMNAFLFFPFGLTAPYALETLPCVKDKKSRPVLITVLAALILSGCIELIQYLYKFGNCELSDIIMNSLGAMIGSVSYLLSSKLTR